MLSRLTSSFEVRTKHPKHVRDFFDSSYREITSGAEQPSDYAGGVIVVDGERVNRAVFLVRDERLGVTAERADSALRVEHCFVLDTRERVLRLDLSPPMNFHIRESVSATRVGAHSGVVVTRKKLARTDNAFPHCSLCGEPRFRLRKLACTTMPARLAVLGAVERGRRKRVSAPVARSHRDGA